MRYDFSVSFPNKASATKAEAFFDGLDIQVKQKMAYAGSIQYYMLSSPSEAVFDIFATKIGARKTGPKALLAK